MAAPFRGDLRPVFDKEAVEAREFVSLGRHDLNQELLSRQVGSREFEAIGKVGLVDVDR